MDIFFSDADRRDYLKMLQEQGEKHGLTFLAWCLMSNHVHLIVIPDHVRSFAKGKHGDITPISSPGRPEAKALSSTTHGG